MKPTKLVTVIVLALATCGAGGSGRHDADVLLALGAGVSGTWETEFEFANPDSNLAVNAFAGEQPFPFVRVAAPCGIAYAPLPRTGSARIVTRASDFGTFTGRLFGVVTVAGRLGLDVPSGTMKSILKRAGLKLER
jgi:hypothetical protein